MSDPMPKPTNPPQTEKIFHSSDVNTTPTFCEGSNYDAGFCITSAQMNSSTCPAGYRMKNGGRSGGQGPKCIVDANWEDPSW